MKTVTIGVRVSHERKEALQRLADAERRTVSQIINFMIETCMTCEGPSRQCFTEKLAPSAQAPGLIQLRKRGPSKPKPPPRRTQS